MHQDWNELGVEMPDGKAKFDAKVVLPASAIRRLPTFDEESGVDQATLKDRSIELLKERIAGTFGVHHARLLFGTQILYSPECFLKRNLAEKVALLPLDHELHHFLKVGDVGLFAAEAAVGDRPAHNPRRGRERSPNPLELCQCHLGQFFVCGGSLQCNLLFKCEKRFVHVVVLRQTPADTIA